MARTAYYFYRLKDDDLLEEFCVANAADPEQSVTTLAPDGTFQQWSRRGEGDLVVFRPPDGYRGGQGVLWSYDRRLQEGRPATLDELERLALRNRVSVHLGN